MNAAAENPQKRVVYLPGLPKLGGEDIELYRLMQDQRMDLVSQLVDRGYKVKEIDPKQPWLKDMLKRAEESDAFIFTPLLLPKHHSNFKTAAAQRWFEFFSVVTGILVGSTEKYQRNGISKPCINMVKVDDTSPEMRLLKDLHDKGMLSSPEEAVKTVDVNRGDAIDYHELNLRAVNTLDEIFAKHLGKVKKTVPAEYPDDYLFKPFRNPDIKNRHPFGIAFFGSATTTESSYMLAAHQLGKSIGERGWRLVTGAGKRGCMGAVDVGFEAGRQAFKDWHPDALFQPVHIGVSTQPILRLEGPPKNIDQLIITPNIYKRIEVMIKGNRVEDENLRTRDAVKVIFVAPGGTGTLHEFATLMQLATNGDMMDHRKIVLLNPPNHLNRTEGFWDSLLHTAKELGFESLFEVADTPRQAMAIADREYEKWQQRHPEHKDLPHPDLNPSARNATWIR